MLPTKPSLDTPVRLVLARHGNTASNESGARGCMSGWTDVALSPLGAQQAHALALRLVQELPGAPVYASSLHRAAATAQAVTRATGAPLVLLDELREIHCGLVDGARIEDVRARYPELWVRNERQDDEDFRWPGGESYREFRTRCIHAVNGIAARHRGGTVVVVTHAGVISELVGAICGVSAARWSCFRPDNASLTELLWTRDSGVVVRFDDQRHLQGVGQKSGQGSGQGPGREIVP